MKCLLCCLLAVLLSVRGGSSGLLGGIVDLLQQPKTSTEHQPLVFPEEEESGRKGLFGRLISPVEKNVLSFKSTQEAILKEIFDGASKENSTMLQKSPSVEETQQKMTTEEVVSTTYPTIPSNSSESIPLSSSEAISLSSSETIPTSSSETITSSTSGPRKKKVVVPVGGDDGRNIIDAPEKGCEEGSKKDALGKCRQVFSK
ncbi:uncharacterized protein LOC124362071 isoform X1 [Homalodisca vitripennis]|uniref:uncharacterized protein LOC124362071 isoform X1 n=1 Tax=Homalodisca vitripennis TaxID=197043 RepID=UPI001EEC0DE0|nr:uncharacterized protein LOC124362071 isoform X1 [Homalodisca vitripennis]